MKATIHITITDNTSEEQLSAAGVTIDQVQKLYHNAFLELVESILVDGCRANLRVAVEDDTKHHKEEDETETPDEVQWSKPGHCPVTPEQFNAIYDDEEAE